MVSLIFRIPFTTSAWTADCSACQHWANVSPMLARLAAKGVHGKAWRLVDALYRSTSTQVRLQGSLSDPFPVRCGVAQGCPVSPVLYAVFADALLEDIEGQCAADGVPVGDKVIAAQSYTC